MRNETETSADLYFYGEIVSSWWGMWNDADQYPEAIRDFLKNRDGKSLNIYIHSNGGSVFAGIAIYNMLKRHKGFKTVYVDGMAASIASVIALAGDKIIVPSNAFIMIHKPIMGGDGNATEHRKMADDLDAVEAGIVNIYKDHLADGVSIGTVTDLMNKETWLNGEEAAKIFNIEIGSAKEYAARVSDKTYTALPATKKAAEATGNTTDKITRLIIGALTEGE